MSRCRQLCCRLVGEPGREGSEARSGGRLGAPMSDDDKIYVDAEQPATLNNSAGKLTDYRTLQGAVMARHRLPPEQTKRATIKVIGGPVYTAAEIVRLHYGPRPALRSSSGSLAMLAAMRRASSRAREKQ